MSKNLWQDAQDATGQLPALIVAAERIAASVSQGSHGRRKKGQGDAFWQFRPYEQGEATRRVDWRQSAKSDGLYVREREWEAAQTLWLWHDGSPSMDYKSHKSLPSKLERSRLLLLALAILLIDAGEQVALLGEDLAPARGQAGIRRLYQHLASKPTDNQAKTLPTRVTLATHSEVVLIGDFLSPLEEIESALKTYNHHRVRGHLVQVLDPAEETLPFQGRIQFNGMEGEGRITVPNVESIRSAYQERLAKRRSALNDLARAYDWSFFRHRSDEPAQTALVELYQAFQHQHGR